MAMNKKRLIDAEELYKELEEVRMDYIDEDSMSSKFAADVIETVQDEYLKKCPVVDAVPVVRCENCRYWERWETIAGVSNKGYCLCHNVDGIEADDFCSYGERKVKCE